jgi:FG-GAP-like repeat
MTTRMLFALVPLLAAFTAQGCATLLERSNTRLPVGKRPNWIVAADVNSDARLDLIVVNGGSSDLSVLLGDGRGGFVPAPDARLPASAGPHLVAVGDLNGDRHADIVSTSHSSHDVSVWLGDGSGRFKPAPGSPFAALASGRAHNHGLALGDLNGDGALDIATTDDMAHAVPILLNDGNARFWAAAGSPVPVGKEPYPLALADVNSDGWFDLITPDVGSGTISVLLGDGKAGFSAAANSPIAVTARPYFVAVADLNSDGHLDILTTHDDVNLVTSLFGDGRGGFKPATTIDVGRRPWEAIPVDMNRDGRMDLVMGAGGAVIVLLGDGRGGFRPAPGSPFRRGSWSIAVGDFDGNGKPDVASLDGDTVTLFFQR